ncbi:uncharacterized protein A1O5_01511 [Cladophialophora psammophila CBS 110553]|uniref:Uncharacterized protein n=1 Tax=Cladophialophora psammophila CBS 110553 TaxID=1182543 RepID=W9XBU2_9EURO|nr:uncharacterized protein A1O5_01511 [Cladophialophora psammophila CBS 110553]EXJ74815.1 hypothetical protein A1O5_01511 [Cladophialophora psammophila CBS 110553]
MNEPQAVRVRFLQDSARMLCLSAPSTSRQLLHESVELVHGGSSHGDRRPGDTCTTCGSLLLPGWTASTKITDTKTKTSKKGHPQKRKPRRKVQSQRCSLCYRVTRAVITMGSSHRAKKEQLNSTVSGERPEEITESAGSALGKATKSSSKKRAKARKDREGLQALLNRSMQTQGVPNLSLMDLMKK